MHFNKVLYTDNGLENTSENNVWNLELNAEKLQEILNRIMQKLMGITISAPKITCNTETVESSLKNCNIMKELRWYQLTA